MLWAVVVVVVVKSLLCALCSGLTLVTISDGSGENCSTFEKSITKLVQRVHSELIHASLFGVC